jgi:hypothetical protein
LWCASISGEAGQSLECAARLVGVADVGGQRHRGTTVVSDLCGDLVEVTLSAGEQSHPYAPAPEADRDRPADTAAGSGDESRSPVERGGHDVPPGVVGVVEGQASAAGAAGTREPVAAPNAVIRDTPVTISGSP